jgi:hypothetical protein
MYYLINSKMSAMYRGVGKKDDQVPKRYLST